MNKLWLPAILADPDFGTERWRRRFLHDHIEAEIHNQQRRRFIGQAFLVAALIAVGAVLYWAATALGLDVANDPADTRTGTIVATATIGIAILALAIFLWDARLKLDKSKLDLLRRDLERYRAEGKD